MAEACTTRFECCDSKRLEICRRDEDIGTGENHANLLTSPPPDQFHSIVEAMGPNELLELRQLRAITDDHHLEFQIIWQPTDDLIDHPQEMHRPLPRRETHNRHERHYRGIVFNRSDGPRLVLDAIRQHHNMASPFGHFANRRRSDLAHSREDHGPLPPSAYDVEAHEQRSGITPDAVHRDDGRDARPLGRSRADIRKRAHDSTMELRDIDTFSNKEARYLAERLRREGDIKGKQRYIAAVHAHTINDTGARCRREYNHLVTGELKMTRKIVDLHLDATETRHIAVGDQRDLESSWSGLGGLRGVGHSTPRDGGRTPFTVVLTVAL